MSVKAMGCDVHRKFSQFSVQRLEDDGEIRVIERKRLEHFDRDAMRSWLARFDAGTPVAMEGAFGWQWLADLLDEVGLDKGSFPSRTWPRWKSASCASGFATARCSTASSV